MRIDRKNVDIGSNGANEKATRDGVGDDGTPAIPLIVNNPTRNKKHASCSPSAAVSGYSDPTCYFYAVDRTRSAQHSPCHSTHRWRVLNFSNTASEPRLNQEETP